MASIYEPLAWQAEIGYRASLKLRNGKPQCRATVYSGRASFHQCSKSGATQGADGIWWCNTHSPEAEAKREADQRAKSEAYFARINRSGRLAQRASEAVAALRLIRDGHNDPRTLAAELLTKYADLETPA